MLLGVRIRPFLGRLSSDIPVTGEGSLFVLQMAVPESASRVGRGNEFRYTARE
jgi:hypothetical protein